MYLESLSNIFLENSIFFQEIQNTLGFLHGFFEIVGLKMGQKKLTLPTKIAEKSGFCLNFDSGAFRMI